MWRTYGWQRRPPEYTPQYRWKAVAKSTNNSSKAAQDEHEGWDCYLVQSPPTDAADPAACEISKSQDIHKTNEDVSVLVKIGMRNSHNDHKI